MHILYQANPPDVSKIPVQDAVGVTVVLLTCCYRNQEFVRVGYFINNEYTDPELQENPPATPQFDKVQHYNIRIKLMPIFLMICLVMQYDLQIESFFSTSYNNK